MEPIIHKDIVIIGAGVAGVSAARTIHSLNRSGRTSPLSYAVLEADSKIGGRVQSEVIHMPSEEPVIISPGAQWFHKDIKGDAAPENCLLPIARQVDPLVKDPMPRIFYNEGRPDEKKNVELINQARALIDAYEGPDMPLADFFNQQNLGTPTALRTTFGEVETGAPLEEVSLIDVRNNVACNMGHFTRKGMGHFFQHFAKDIKPNIKTDCPVKRIKWDPEGKAETTIETTDGKIFSAKKCIITVSVGVLKSGNITFDPPLPPSHQKNLEHIYMGNFNKAFIVFDEGFQIPVPQNTHVDLRTKDVERKSVYSGDGRAVKGQDMFYLSNDNAGKTSYLWDNGKYSRGWNVGKSRTGKDRGRLMTAFYGGDLARLCDQSPEDAANLAIRGLVEIWGENVRSHIRHAKVTQWGAKPLVQGGYSRVDIGHHDARQELAKPFGNNRLAGEAYGTIHPESGRNWATHMTGAAISGERAAIESILEIRPEIRKIETAYSYKAKAAAAAQTI